MTWVKLDDGFFRNPKARAAGKNGRALYLAGLCHSSGELTDGRIPKASLPLVAAEAEVPASTARRLVEAGLWLDDGDGYRVPDFLEFNPSAEKVRAERAAARERMKRRRSPDVPPNIEANGDGTSKEVPLPPSPSPTPPLGSPPSATVRAPLGEDEDDKVQQVLERLVEAKCSAANGRIRNRTAYRARALETARLEHGGDVRQILATHTDDVPVQSIVGHLLGEPNVLTRYRR